MSAVAGIALASGAACCFNGAVALQALEVRRLPVGSASGLTPLLRRRRWLAATGLSIAGWPLHIAALAVAPLTVVQPALATGLILLLVLGARLLHEPVRAADLAAVAAIAGGLALLAWAAPEQGTVHVGPAGPGTGGARPDRRAALAHAWPSARAGVRRARPVPATPRPGSRPSSWPTPASRSRARLGFGHRAGGRARADGRDGGAAALGAARVAAGAFALQTAVPVLLAPSSQARCGLQPVAILVAVTVVVGRVAAPGRRVARRSPARRALSDREPEHRVGGAAGAARRWPGAGGASPARAEIGPEPALAGGDRGEAEVAERAVVDPDVADAPAVGDRPRAAQLGLAHGQPRRRVHQHVRGGDPLADPRREALGPDPPVLQPRPQAVVGPAQADRGPRPPRAPPGRHSRDRPDPSRRRRSARADRRRGARAARARRPGWAGGRTPAGRTRAPRRISASRPAIASTSRRDSG